MKITENLKVNKWPLVTLLFFLFISIAAIFRDEIKSLEEEKTFNQPIRIGLFKQNDDQPFKELREKILESIPNKVNIQVTIDYFSKFDTACDLMKEEQLDILGEVTPNVYVDRSVECNFEPFVGIEYQDDPYYRSILFSSLENDDMCGVNFTSKSGENNLGNALEKLEATSNNKCKVAYVDDEKSTSRYYYPVSYLMDKSIPTEAMQPLSNDREVFDSIVNNGLNGNPKMYVAGFLPDYKYNKYSNENDGFYKQKVIILDTTDPIPNGLFVVRKGVFTKINKDVKNKIIDVWKGIRNIGKEGSKVTGWRTGQSLLRDLELVKHHKLKVDNKNKLKGSYKKIASVVFVIIITILLLSTTVLLGWKKNGLANSN